MFVDKQSWRFADCSDCTDFLVTLPSNSGEMRTFSVPATRDAIFEIASSDVEVLELGESRNPDKPDSVTWIALLRLNRAKASDWNGLVGSYSVRPVLVSINRDATVVLPLLGNGPIPIAWFESKAELQRFADDFVASFHVPANWR